MQGGHGRAEVCPLGAGEQETLAREGRQGAREVVLHSLLYIVVLLHLTSTCNIDTCSHATYMFAVLNAFVSL